MAKKDCSNGNDESDECVKLKSARNCTKSCAPNGRCHNFPNGPQCICPNGYQFNEDKEQCEDVNECLEFGKCSQGCVNTFGSFKCACAPGFRLERDNRTCSVFRVTDPILLYAASKSVNWIQLRGATKHLKRVAEKLNQVIGVCYDGKYVYWTDISVQVESIMKAKKDGSDLQTLFTAGLSKPEDVAVDFVTGNIYFTDNDYQHVAVCSNDARYCKAIVTQNVHRPRGIALHPQKGKMYWSDWGLTPMIAVASMDGSNMQPLITEDITWPNGLALDWPNNRLYWVDAKSRSIENCRLDGSDRRQVIKQVSKHPYGIAVFQDSLYWSDWDSKSIQSCNKFTGKNRTTIIRDNLIYDIHIYHPAMQNFSKNPCIESGCSHLCLLNENDSYTCDCPKFMELTADKHKCRTTDKQKAILMAIGNRLVIFEHQSFGKHEDGEGKTLPYQVDKMTFNSITGDVIVADNKRKVIIQVSLENYATKVLMSESINNVTALSFDELANNLYWTDAERSTIEVYSFNTRQRAVVQHFMGSETPIALAAITEIGKLYVALRSFAHTHIDQLSPNGRGPHFHMLEEELGNGPISMVVDYELKEIFWTDYAQSKISYTDFHGETHHTFLYDVNHPVSLAIIGDDIFWSTSKSIKLNWTPKHSYVGTKSMHIEHPFTTSTAADIELLTISPVTTHSKHPCNEGVCSHICIAMGKTVYSCLCPAGTVFKNAHNSTCVPHTECFFRCGSGECVTEEQRCNGVKNCLDFSDEEDCQERQKFVTCEPNQFTCLDRMKCIDRENRCDKNIDCDDGSDEKDCKDYIKETKCHKNQFLCSNGHCIDSNALCDGFKDCSSGEDELASNCRNSESRTCNANEFKCSNNQCIPNAWLCDGSLDCSNDEENCVSEECAENMMRCEHGTCISKALWCNGDNDCGDFSDEINCAEWFHSERVEVECGDGDSKLFQCKSNKTICLDMEKRCNGYTDCPKGEDEMDCKDCTVDEFKCADSGQCVLQSWRCDGVKDCKDASDEKNCNSTSHLYHSHHYHARCTESEFKCKNGEYPLCVDWDRVCNGDKDCSDGSDEGLNCESSCRNSPCQHLCNKSPNGPVCACRDGFALDSDKKSCIDINECANSTLPCAQKCENTIGSYRCSCFRGFQLSADKISCKSIESKSFMFYSSYDTIYRMGTHLTTAISTNDSKIIGMGMNFDKQLLYFTIEDSEALYEFNWTDSRMNSVKNIGIPTKVAVDWITDNVYFIDKSVAIKVCHMEERNCITLIEMKSGGHIKSLDIDALHQSLFYVTVKKPEFDTLKSTVIAHKLDGNRIQVLSEDSFFVSALTSDFYTERVYYVSFDTRSIWSVKYDGTGKQLMITRNEFITRPIGINLFESHAYVSNADSKILAKCALYGDRVCKPLGLNVNQADNLVIVQKSRQKSTENSCTNHKCNTICVPTDLGRKCICDYGQTIAESSECNRVGAQQNQPIFHQHTTGDRSNGGRITKMVLGTLSIIMVLLLVVMGALFIYKRLYGKQNINISMHFENSRSAIDAARVKMSKLNEIMIHRRGNKNNNQTTTAKQSTVVEEQEISGFTNFSDTTLDDTQRLLI
ncbi:putative vitellogenin receptor isoform X2 [Contarinia nasturtii]|uniref:putative vitellogenin receptor isoform X2 n=1 Tax=Contarinia nasturtii TaxID=265458 RepID=UPI0012D41BAD|nr:putative vitellogenin receptor isoform X2 [Contarinia nasturtii]